MVDVAMIAIIVVGFLAWVAADYARWRWSYSTERERRELRRQADAWRAILHDIDDKNAGIVRLTKAPEEKR